MSTTSGSFFVTCFPSLSGIRARLGIMTRKILMKILQYDENKKQFNVIMKLIATDD